MKSTTGNNHQGGIPDDGEICESGRGVKMPIIRKIVRSDCAACERESYCYFGVAFNNFSTLSRVVFDDEGFSSCLKVGTRNAKSEEEGK